MFRTDHCYPPTVRAPLDDSPVFDFHFEAIAMPPAPLPPVVEPLAPSPRRTNNPPLPDVANGTARTLLDAKPKPPRRVPWLACAVGAAMFAVGYLLGRWLP